MKVIGITGASGSGKTTISQILNTRKDTKVVNADKMAKQMTNTETEYFMAIKSMFHEDEILLDDETLNRAKLAKLIYENEEYLKKLNQLTFQYLIPKIVNEIKNVTNDIKIVIIDAPLLFESGLDKYCDHILTLLVPDSLKVKRICKRDGISEEIAKERLKIQKKNDFYVKKSDYVIVNDENTTIEDLEKKLNKILQKI